MITENVRIDRHRNPAYSFWLTQWPEVKMKMIIMMDNMKMMMMENTMMENMKMMIMENMKMKMMSMENMKMKMPRLIPNAVKPRVPEVPSVIRPKVPRVPTSHVINKL